MLSQLEQDEKREKMKFFFQQLEQIAHRSIWSIWGAGTSKKNLKTYTRAVKQNGSPKAPGALRFAPVSIGRLRRPIKLEDFHFF